MCGCTLSMSIMKPSADRLPAMRSNTPADVDAARGRPRSRPGRRSRRACAAAPATRRPCRAPRARRASSSSCTGTSCSTACSAGLRKNLSIDFSTSEQRRAQLLDDAAHRLPVGDAPVELLHPRLERLGRLLLAHQRKPFAEALDALGVLGLVEVAVLERGLEIEQAGRHLHRQRRRRRGLRCLRLLHRGLQLGGERSRRTGTGAAANRRPARTARRGRRGDAARRRRSPTRLPSRRRRASSRGRRSPDRSGRGRCASSRSAPARRSRRRRARRVRRGTRMPRPAGAGLRAEEQDVAREPLGDVGVAALQAGGTAPAGARRRAW